MDRIRDHFRLRTWPKRWPSKFSDRIEMALTSVFVRVLLSWLPLDRTLCLLDRIPPRRNRGDLPFRFPEDRQLRLAGACLGRSLVRSQYLRNRGVSHQIVIGTAGNIGSFQAHAWVAPFENAPDGFITLRSIPR
jgi:hypothetical protein